MAAIAFEPQIGRRAHHRLRLGVPARLSTLNGIYEVRLDNLSQTGAHIFRPQGDQQSKAILQWLDFDAFSKVVWQRAGYCGLVFENPLPESWMVKTRGASSTYLEAREKSARAAASEWMQNLKLGMGR